SSLGNKRMTISQIGILFAGLAFLPVAGLAENQNAHAAAVTSIAADPAGQFLITGSEDKTVRIWELPIVRASKVISIPAGEDPEGKILAVAVSPDGKTIACGGYTGSRKNAEAAGKSYFNIYLYERSSGRALRTLAVPFVTEGLAYSPSAAYLVATSHGAFDSVSGDFGSYRVFRL